jgi:hypothetical protein
MSRATIRSFLPPLALLLTCSRTSRAADLFTLDVTRSAEVTDCPDAQNLAGSVALLEGRFVLRASAPAEAHRIEVSIDRDRQARYRATIRVPGARSASREISDDAANCGPLWDALTLALALIVDNDRSRSAAPTEPQRRAPAARVPENREADHGHVGLGVGGLLSSGAIRSFAAGVVGDAVFEMTRRTTLRVQGRILETTASSFGPGTVQIALFAGLVEGCYALNGQPRPVQVWGCAAMGAGVLRGSAQGYLNATARSRPWIAAGGGLSADFPVSDSWGVWVGADALALLLREEFAIGGIANPAYHPSAVGISAGAGLRTTIW